MKQVTRSLIAGLIFLTFIAAFIFVVPQLKAQTKPQLMVVVTQYKPQQNLDFFFLNSAHPLTFVEEPGETPVFVSIISPSQKDAYVTAGYNPIIVDQNAGEVSQYFILNGTRHQAPNYANELQDETSKQQGLQFAYQLSKYYILIKLDKESSYAQLTNPVLNKLHARQLHWNLVPRLDRNSQAVIQAFPFSPTPVAYLESAKKATWSADPEWVLSFFLILLIFLFLFYSQKGKTR